MRTAADVPQIRPGDGISIRMSTSLESFVNVLKRSGLVDEPVIARSLDARTDGADAPTGENFAEYLVETDVITAWQAAKLLQGKHKGFFLGKYKLLRLLGKGGMSSVYLAEHVLMRRRCAIKVLPWKLVKDSSYLERFHREAQAVAALDHPNIVRAYDIDHEKDGSLEIHFLVMEYVEGRNLFDLVQMSGPLPARTAADYIRQGALGLAHAHKSGMVHRDVKPGNFIVDQHGTVKLMDLGLARVAADDADHSLTIAHDERVLGTADYLAPEQAVDSHLVDTRADLYSLGCTLYFLLTGRPPFNEGTLTQRLLAHQTKEPTPIETLRPDVPESLLDILRSLMMKDREQRLQTAEEASALLTDWLSASPRNSAAPASKPKPVPPVPETGSPEMGSPAEVAPIETGTTSSASEVVETPTKKWAHESAQGQGQGQGLGDFLSSLSDVEPSSGKGEEPRKHFAKSGPKISSSASPKISRTGERPEAVLASPGPAFPETELVFSDSSTSSDTGLPSAGLSGTESAHASRKGKKAFAIPEFVPKLKSLLQQYWPPSSRLLIAAATTGVVLLSVIAWLIFGRGHAIDQPASPSDVAVTPATPDVPERPAVTGTFITVGPKGNFGTLQEAINYIQDHAFETADKPVREIHLAGKQTFKESISIDNSGLGSFPRGVKIIGEAANPPRLASGGTGPVLSLNSIDGFALQHVVLDCKGLPQGVELQGFMSSVLIANVKFENVQNVAILGVGLGGINGQPAVIQNCTFTSTSASAVGLKFEPSLGKDTRELMIRRCRFLGPFQNAASFQGEVDSVTFSENLFHEAASAIAFSGSDPLRKQLIFTNNTFHNCERGIAFETGPSSQDARYSFQKNLFVGGSGPAVSTDRSDVNLARLTANAPPTDYNWTDRKELGSNDLNIFAGHGKLGVDVEFASEDPHEGVFLKPKANGIVLSGEEIAAPAYIGAVAP